jgi:hypothetical protein
MSYDAGWNQTIDDWLRLLRLEPAGCFGIRCDGRLAATTTLMCHGTDLAWLGMVLTRPAYQHRGFAKELLGTSLHMAEHKGIPCVKLDATDQGRLLYLKFGFADEQPIERWLREPGPLTCSEDELMIGVPDLDLDREAFGTDRGRFLSTLGPTARFEDAFVMQRTGSRARYLGPCVARNPAAAAYAIRATIAARAGETWFWDLLPKNTEAVKIAHTLGFRPVRHLMRMRRGSPLSGDDSLVYATAGFEAG